MKGVVIGSEQSAGQEQGLHVEPGVLAVVSVTIGSSRKARSPRPVLAIEEVSRGFLLVELW
jgi:hypothetical protein